MVRFASVICALGALALGGCQTTKSPNEMSYVELKQYAASLVERCKQEGAKPGPETQACINQEARADEAKRQTSIRQRQALAQAFKGLGDASAAYSQSMQNAAYANRPVTCYSTPFRSNLGGPVSSVTTTCQ